MIDENILGKLIKKAASTNQRPEIKYKGAAFSPGFICVFLCGELVHKFDTYYITAKGKAEELVNTLIERINNTNKSSENLLWECYLVMSSGDKSEILEMVKRLEKYYGASLFVADKG